MGVLGIVLWSSETRGQAIVAREDNGRLVCMTRTPVAGVSALAVGDVVDFDIQYDGAVTVTRCAVVSTTAVNPAEWIMDVGRTASDRVTIARVENEVLSAANSPAPIKRIMAK